MHLEAIPGANQVYDVLLVMIVCSIFFLSPLRFYSEYQERQRLYQRYIDAARDVEGNRNPSKSYSQIAPVVFEIDEIEVTLGSHEEVPSSSSSKREKDVKKKLTRVEERRSEEQSSKSTQ